jgi:hypothetical protein
MTANTLFYNNIKGDVTSRNEGKYQTNRSHHDRQLQSSQIKNEQVLPSQDKRLKQGDWPTPKLALKYVTKQVHINKNTTIAYESHQIMAHTMIQSLYTGV